jgi:hypothetical protein
LSQAGQINSAAGPVPPAVPTSFVTDNGTAIPAANVLNTNGVDSTENNVNGILTKATPNLSNNWQVVLSNRLQGTVSTSDATPTAIVTFTPTVVGTYAIEGRIAAFNTTSTLGAGYSIFGTIRWDAGGGGTATLCGSLDKIINEEGAMSSANVTMTVAGGSVSINAVGYAAEAINWSFVGLYTFVGV